MHRVAVLALKGIVLLDLAIPCEVFGRARLADGRPAYHVEVCAPERELDAGWFRVLTRAGLRSLAKFQTVIVAGICDASIPTPPEIVRALRRCAERGARVASICSGAFALADAGLLHGLRATTHWFAAGELARRHPTVEVDPNVLFVDNGNILTSAGAAAAFDLCLHMIRLDHGANVAASAARLSVMPLERSGGQAQFIDNVSPTPESPSLEPVLRWIEQSMDATIDVSSIARRAAMSTRTLVRRFREQTGTTPKQYLIRARIRQSQRLLENTGDSIERVAAKVGFGSATTFRTAFARVVGTSPTSYRASFRSKRR